jgi:hypothetical protein
MTSELRSDHGKAMTCGLRPHHPGKDLGFAQVFASGFARIKARMTSELRSDHGGIITMMSELRSNYKFMEFYKIISRFKQNVKKIGTIIYNMARLFHHL